MGRAARDRRLVSARGTLFGKVWAGRVVDPLPGGNALLFCDRVVTYELLGARAALTLQEQFGDRIYDPARAIAVTDHVAPAKDSDSAIQAHVLRLWARRKGVTMYDLGDGGICHVVVPERGWIEPGMVACCSDSHTCTLGAFGAFALGVGTTTLTGALLAGALVLREPKVMRVRVNGRLGTGATAKDLALAVAVRLGFGGGTGYVLEYQGETIDALTMEERMTVCNMAIEAGATTGIFAPDETTIAYLRQTELQRDDPDAFARKAARWRTLRADPDAEYDAELVIDAGALRPTISWGTNPSQAVPIDGRVPADAPAADLAYMGLEPGRRCAASRSTRPSSARAPTRGSTTCARRRACCAASACACRRSSRRVSEAVRRAAEQRGIAATFQDAGALWTHATCGACCGSSMGVLAPGMRCVSSSNRNFPGRMGEGGRVHLSAPQIVAASAVLGRIASADELSASAEMLA